jgi:hypothetical protein
MRRAVPPALAAAGLLLLTACGGSSAPAAQAAPSAAPVPSPSPLPTCAPAGPATYAWPSPVPADLPRLPGATLGATKRSPDGLTIVRFSTSTGLRDAVLFIVRELPKAGYTLGRGDAEPTEADAPFSKGDLRGVLRGAMRTQCATDWILAVTRVKSSGGGSPLLPAHTGPSPSPLPFG